VWALVAVATALFAAPNAVPAQGVLEGRRIAGESRTLLPDGRWILVGGLGRHGPLGTVAVCNPARPTLSVLPVRLQHPRAWHSATTLPDGMVLIAGGVGPRGFVSPLELFDPRSERVVPGVSWSPARAGHSVTVLSDGRVLVLGGMTDLGIPAASVEVWSPDRDAVSATAHLVVPRYNHDATLLSDGRVLVSGGFDATGRLARGDEIFDPGLEGSFAVDSSAEALEERVPPPRLSC
jgi:hypothetical protein